MRLLQKDTERQKELEQARAELSVLAQDPNVRRMLELLEWVKSAESPQPLQRLTNSERITQEVRETHTDEECEYAKAFICRVFADCIRDQEVNPHVYFAIIEANKETRAMGILQPSTPNKGTEHRGVNAEWLSIRFIDVILAGRMAEKTDEEVVWDMIAYSESDPLGIGGPMFPELYFLTAEEGDERRLELWTHYFGFDDVHWEAFVQQFFPDSPPKFPPGDLR